MLPLSVSKSKPAVKDNLDRLFSLLFKFSEGNVIMFQRFHGMIFLGKVENKLTMWVTWFILFDHLEALCLFEMPVSEMSMPMFSLPCNDRVWNLSVSTRSSRLALGIPSIILLTRTALEQTSNINYHFILLHSVFKLLWCCVTIVLSVRDKHQRSLKTHLRKKIKAP